MSDGITKLAREILAVEAQIGDSRADQFRFLALERGFQRQVETRIREIENEERVAEESTPRATVHFDAPDTNNRVPYRLQKRMDEADRRAE